MPPTLCILIYRNFIPTDDCVNGYNRKRQFIFFLINICKNKKKILKSSFKYTRTVLSLDQTQQSNAFYYFNQIERQRYRSETTRIRNNDRLHAAHVSENSSALLAACGQEGKSILFLYFQAQTHTSVSRRHVSREIDQCKDRGQTIHDEARMDYLLHNTSTCLH